MSAVFINPTQGRYLPRHTLPMAVSRGTSKQPETISTFRGIAPAKKKPAKWQHFKKRTIFSSGCCVKYKNSDPLKSYISNQIMNKQDAGLT